MTQRDEGHDYRDSKNRAMEYERKQAREKELSAINSVFECGVPEQLNVVLEKVLSGVGIVWNKTKALQITNERYN